MLTSTPVSQRLGKVKNIILVLSGKGGVGKSSVSTQLALSLYDSNPQARVGILDIDLTGPSIPRMMGVDGTGVHQSSSGWVPVYADGQSARLACMSVGFLLKKKEDSVVWRGPKKNAMIRQFLSDVRWDELDYLIIDTPPGTSDEHISLIEHLSFRHESLYAVLVTTPQVVALTDVMKCLSFARTVSLPILGLIENMSGFVCPCCGEVSKLFSTGGGEELASRENVNFLGSLPVDTELAKVLDGLTRPPGAEENQSFHLLEQYKSTPSYTRFASITSNILDQINK